MADPGDMWQHLAHISDVQTHRLFGSVFGIAVGPSVYQHTLQSWSAAGQDDSGNWFAYYFVELDSLLHTALNGTYKLDEYFLQLILVDHTGLIMPETKLLDVSPDTTVGSTSYTTSTSESYSASGGFFGTTPTLNLGASLSFGRSVTRSIPDIAVHNQSLSVNGQNATWGLSVTEDAAAQSDTIQFTGQALFRVPTSPSDTAKRWVQVGLEVLTSDHDNNGSDYFDKTITSIQPNLDGTTITPYGDRGCYLNFKPFLFSLKPPAVPKS